MSAQTPVASLTYAELADVPDANAASETLANNLDHVVIPKYPSTGSRDAANTAPIEGDACYVTGNGYYFYSGSVWVGPYNWNSNWKNFTPTWSTSTGLHTPSIGNGTMGIKYLQLGKIVFFALTIIFGTTTNFNSGTSTDNWQWSLPIAGDTTFDGHMEFSLSGVSTTIGRGFLATAGTNLSMSICSGRADGLASTSGNVDAVSPFAWSADPSNTIKGGGWYPAA